MAELANAYAESNDRSTSTTTTVGGANKVSLGHTPADNARWLYIWSAVLDGSVTTADARARLRNETAAADWAVTFIEPQDTTNRNSIGGFKVHQYGASPGAQTIDIDYWMESAGTVGIADACLFGIELGPDDYSVEDDAQDASTDTGAYKTSLTLSETLTGDYLFLASAEISHSANSGNTRIRADKGGTKYGFLDYGFQDATTWRTWATGFKLTGLSGTQTVTIEFQPAASTATIRRRRIVAIKLDRFSKNGYAENRSANSHNNTTPADQTSLTFSPDAARNHVALAGMMMNNSSNSINAFGEFERDGTALHQCQEEVDAANDDFPMFAVKRESLTTGDKVYKTQKWVEGIGAVVEATESWIIVLDLEAASTGTNISPAAAQLAASGTAPAVATRFNISPPAGNLALSSAAPGLAQAANLSPAAAQAAISSAAPTPSLTARTSISPPAGDLAATGSAPLADLTADQFASPPAAQAAISAAAPDTILSDHREIAPAAAQIAASAAAPALFLTSRTDISPPGGAAVLDAVAPLISLTANILVSVPAADLVLSSLAPVVDLRTGAIERDPTAAAAARTPTGAAAGRAPNAAAAAR